MTALKTARAAVAATITTTLATAAPTATVYAYEPPTLGGTVVTVSTAGVSPTDWRLYIRVYVPTIQSQEGQDTLDDVVAAIDADPTMLAVPRSEWSWEYDEQRDTFLMQTVVEYPRDDF